MEAIAYIKHIRVSPKKLRFIVDGIRLKKPEEALIILSQSQKRNAKVLYKAIHSAVSNAKAVMKITTGEGLKFKTLLIEEGPFLKRMRPASRGRASFYKKRSSHIKVVLFNDEQKPAIVKVPQETKKARPEPTIQSKTKVTKVIKNSKQ